MWMQLYWSLTYSLYWLKKWYYRKLFNQCPDLLCSCISPCPAGTWRRGRWSHCRPWARGLSRPRARWWRRYSRSASSSSSKQSPMIEHFAGNTETKKLSIIPLFIISTNISVMIEIWQNISKVEKLHIMIIRKGFLYFWHNIKSKYITLREEPQNYENNETVCFHQK